jgi:hypothetical protein
MANQQPSLPTNFDFDFDFDFEMSTPQTFILPYESGSEEQINLTLPIKLTPEEEEEYGEWELGQTSTFLSPFLSLRNRGI